jgi:hypothetical protein
MLLYTVESIVLVVGICDEFEILRRYVVDTRLFMKFVVISDDFDFVILLNKMSNCFINNKIKIISLNISIKNIN